VAQVAVEQAIEATGRWDESSPEWDGSSLENNQVAVDTNSNALCFACMLGELVKVQALLKGCADVNRPSANGCMPLILATQHGFTDIMDVLLSRSTAATLDVIDVSGETPLTTAATYGQADALIKLLARSADVMKRNRYGNTPLMCARMRDHPSNVCANVYSVIAETLEAAAAPMVVTLHAREPEADCAEIRCLSMGGKEIINLHVSVEDELLGAVRKRVVDQLHMPSWKLKLVLPNGHVLAPSNDDMVLFTLLDAGTSSATVSVHSASEKFVNAAQGVPHQGAVWLARDSQPVLSQCSRRQLPEHGQAPQLLAGDVLLAMV